jgi:hypothetical protein
MHALEYSLSGPFYVYVFFGVYIKRKGGKGK